MLKGESTQNELTSRYGIHSTQLYQWKKQVLDALPEIFAGKKKHKDQTQEDLVNELYRQIGELKVQLDWMKKNLNYSVNNKRACIDLMHKELSVRMQCKLIELNRSSLYYCKREINADTLRI